VHAILRKGNIPVPVKVIFALRARPFLTHYKARLKVAALDFGAVRKHCCE